jgi:hypothetical protein
MEYVGIRPIVIQHGCEDRCGNAYIVQVDDIRGFEFKALVRFFNKQQHDRLAHAGLGELHDFLDPFGESDVWR